MGIFEHRILIPIPELFLQFPSLKWNEKMKTNRQLHWSLNKIYSILVFLIWYMTVQLDNIYSARARFSLLTAKYGEKIHLCTCMMIFTFYNLSI